VNPSQSPRGGARVDHSENEDSMATLKTFQGTSKAGNLQKALDTAIQAAQQSAPGADRLVTWTLKKVAGRRGGIAGFRDVTVTIGARIS
jgi:hypothetical protein